MESSSRSQSPIDERNILNSWQPEPLVPTIDTATLERQNVFKPNIITSKPDIHIRINGIDSLNFVTPNYLGLVGNKRLEAAALAGASKYGVGSCGPRAFYGTMDVHLQLEQELASFLQVQEAILYSFGFTTIASAIPAYAKANDIVFADECCNFAIQQGMAVSRANIFLFRHNDFNHLRELIEKVGSARLKTTRSFLIVEGIYDRTGTMCPLPELIEIKKEFKIRLFIDESHSFGVLGHSGRGITQHYGVDINDIDLIMAGLENALCAYGGFCAGPSFVVDHQRIGGSGYIFSASLPPLQILVALEALKIINENPGIVKKAQEMFKHSNQVLSNLEPFKLISHELSPLKHLILRKYSDNPYKFLDEQLSDNIRKQLRFDKKSSLENSKEAQKQAIALQQYSEDLKKLENFCQDTLKSKQVALNVSRYIVDEEMTLPIPSLKIMIPGSMSYDNINLLSCLLKSYHDTN